VGRHAHGHDLSNRITSHVFNANDLAEDFANCEITCKPGESKGTELTGISTSDLAGNAESDAAKSVAIEIGIGGDADCFDKTAVTEAKQKFSCRILRTGCANDR